MVVVHTPWALHEVAITSVSVWKVVGTAGVVELAGAGGLELVVGVAVGVSGILMVVVVHTPWSLQEVAITSVSVATGMDSELELEVEVVEGTTVVLENRVEVLEEVVDGLMVDDLVVGVTPPVIVMVVVGSV